MASRFVSAGTINAASGEAVQPPEPSSSTGKVDTASNGVTPSTSTSQPTTQVPQTARNSEWAAVQAQLDAERKQRDDERRRAADAHGAGSGDRSLYEVLQANKAAKQAAFEEKNKIKNQFRALDDDEIDFLDGVRSSEREKEARNRKEMEEGMKAFRDAQRKKDTGGEDAEHAGDEEDGDEVEGESWAVTSGRKRKREKDRGVIKGLKRQASDLNKQPLEKSESDVLHIKKASRVVEDHKPPGDSSVPQPDKPPVKTSRPALGLVSYDSDDEDE